MSKTNIKNKKRNNFVNEIMQKQITNKIDFNCNVNKHITFLDEENPHFEWNISIIYHNCGNNTYKIECDIIKHNLTYLRVNKYKFTKEELHKKEIYKRCQIYDISAIYENYQSMKNTQKITKNNYIFNNFIIRQEQEDIEYNDEPYIYK
jgi:16S rRNA C967 or C1407 C5-methylase (RsmB/RsmF family)